MEKMEKWGIEFLRTKSYLEGSTYTVINDQTKMYYNDGYGEYFIVRNQDLTEEAPKGVYPDTQDDFGNITYASYYDMNDFLFCEYEEVSVPEVEKTAIRTRLEKEVYSLEEIANAIYIASNEAKKSRDKQNSIWERKGRCAELYAQKNIKERLNDIKDVALKKLLCETGIMPISQHKQISAYGEIILLRYEIAGNCIHRIYDRYDNYLERKLLHGRELSSIPTGDTLRENTPVSNKEYSMTAEAAEELLCAYTATTADQWWREDLHSPFFGKETILDIGIVEKNHCKVVVN